MVIDKTDWLARILKNEYGLRKSASSDWLAGLRGNWGFTTEVK